MLKHTPSYLKKMIVKVPFLIALLCSLLIACSKPTTTSTTNSGIGSGNLTLTDKGRSLQEKILNDVRVNLSDIQGLSSTELRLIRNTVFARHGRKYDKNPELQSYFNTFSWYKPRDDYSDAELTQVDRDNVKTILALEKPAVSPSRTSDTAQQSTNPVPQANPIDGSGGSMEEQALRAERRLFEFLYIKCGDSYFNFQQMPNSQGVFEEWKGPVNFTLESIDRPKNQGAEWSGVIRISWANIRNGTASGWLRWYGTDHQFDHISKQNSGWVSRMFEYKRKYNQRISCGDLPR